MLRQLSHVKNSGWSIVEGDHITWFNDFNGDYGRLAARFLTMLTGVNHPPSSGACWTRGAHCDVATFHLPVEPSIGATKREQEFITI